MNEYARGILEADAVKVGLALALVLLVAFFVHDKES